MSAICFVASIVLLVAALPMDTLMEALRIWIGSLGFWGPLAFAITYGIAATLFIPASALSLAAGVLFGIWLGTAAVWLGATLAIALSFLIARYIARARVEELAKTRPRFAAVDRAVGEQGWKIVALTRLSPVFPFNLQNYLFGVTAIRFWPYCIASAAFILPGTFLYVYLGYAGGEAAAAVGGVGRADGLKLALQLVGLLATLIVTVVIARIAAKAISKHAPGEIAPSGPSATKSLCKGSMAKKVGALALSIACLLASLTAFVQRESIRSLFPTPSVELFERYALEMVSSPFERGPLDALSGTYIDSSGLGDASAPTVVAIGLVDNGNTLAEAPFGDMERGGKLVLPIIGDSACPLQWMVGHRVPHSTHSIQFSDRTDVSGGRHTLNRVEQALFRPSVRQDPIRPALVSLVLGHERVRRGVNAGSLAGIQFQFQSEVTRRGNSESGFRDGLKDFKLPHGIALAGFDLRKTWLPSVWNLRHQLRLEGALPAPIRTAA